MAVKTSNQGKIVKCVVGLVAVEEDGLAAVFVRSFDYFVHNIIIRLNVGLCG